MATITFDVYMPAGQAPTLRSAFLHTARDLPGVAGTRLSVNVLPKPVLPEGAEELLAATYATTRHNPAVDEGESPTVVRFVILAPDFTGSVNQLAMRLSRVLTPAVNLPADRVLLENEQEFEVAAIYPWMVVAER
ncbi:hypothetical protein HMPREF1219_00897 [Corynebacterium pyruviciproducens ATCC BAA-1742]|uniref:Uncharacterized protein n=1 Tax=Corynebacterium pyruviciproducens ATCC BAA-1742 TaxID=1125779 RepID=S2ZIP7_9CORY|nr:hypothetical protein [Corynebacterium pyruviciproducens]EPD69952.1 hypothetical protein HMPREF1219_00897 [Corynebacterium pyruviciproducens ATCC BAA-1742]